MCDCSDPEGCLLSSKKRGLEDKSVSTRSLENAELVDLDGDSAAPKGVIYLCRGPDHESCELYPWNPDTCGKASNPPRDAISGSEHTDNTCVRQNSA